VRNGLYDIESGCREIGHDISHGVSAGVFPALWRWLVLGWFQKLRRIQQIGAISH